MLPSSCSVPKQSTAGLLSSLLPVCLFLTLTHAPAHLLVLEGCVKRMGWCDLGAALPCFHMCHGTQSPALEAAEMQLACDAQHVRAEHSECDVHLQVGPHPGSCLTSATKVLGKALGRKRICDTFQDEQQGCNFLLYGEKWHQKPGRSGLSALPFPLCLHHSWWQALTSCSKPQGCPLLSLLTVRDTTRLVLAALFSCCFSTCPSSKRKILILCRQWLGCILKC